MTFATLKAPRLTHTLHNIPIKQVYFTNLKAAVKIVYVHFSHVMCGTAPESTLILITKYQLLHATKKKMLIQK